MSQANVSRPVKVSVRHTKAVGRKWFFALDSEKRLLILSSNVHKAHAIGCCYQCEHVRHKGALLLPLVTVVRGSETGFGLQNKLKVYRPVLLPPPTLLPILFVVGKKEKIRFFVFCFLLSVFACVFQCKVTRNREAA